MTEAERTFWLQGENSFSGRKVRSALSDAAFLGVLILVVAGFYFWGPKISVVLSDSMIPTYTAGDALLVVPWGNPGVGDIAQFRVPLAPGQEETTVPVTHRIVGQDERGYITKGDNPTANPDTWRVTSDMIDGYVVFWMPRTWMFRLASGLIGMALLLFLWPRDDEEQPEADGRLLYPGQPMAQNLPWGVPPPSCRPQTALDHPVLVTPLSPPQGRQVTLPPPVRDRAGAL